MHTSSKISMMNRLTYLLVATLLSACASTPKPASTPQAAQPRPPVLALKQAQFSDLNGWGQIDFAPALYAFRRSCTVAAQRAPDAPFSNAAKYGGKVQDWMPACAAALTAAPETARAFFEQYFRPYKVTDEGDGMQKMTGYYEPVIAARKVPEPGFDEPIYGRPSDLLQIDLGQFAKTYNSPADTNLKGTIWGKVSGTRVVPYPARGQRAPDSAAVLAYAHAADVYDLQVQGSARLNFPDSPPIRAGYAAGNGWKWNSIYKTLRDRNQIPADQLNKPTVRAWMDQAGPVATKEVMNTDPSEVFFTLEPIPDPNVGPKGAQGVPLTPQGSMAVDPSFHPYGGLIFLDGEGPDINGQTGPFHRLAVAQDTGGAIRRGPLRGDFFFGSGDAAGKLAQTMNAPAGWWTLLPSADAALIQK